MIQITLAISKYSRINVSIPFVYHIEDIFFLSKSIASRKDERKDETKAKLEREDKPSITSPESKHTVEEASHALLPPNRIYHNMSSSRIKEI